MDKKSTYKITILPGSTIRYIEDESSELLEAKVIEEFDVTSAETIKIKIERKA